ncbi:hypothetical protein ACVWWJ_003170 [Luteibacter sp. HA06]
MTPLLVSQSQISVPSPSMATTRNPPPGNTTTVVPVGAPFGGTIVMVGRVTFSMMPPSLTDSGPVTGGRAIEWPSGQSGI